MEFTNKDGIKLVDKVISTIQENRDYLSQIDGEAGDGDHGINMNKGMTFAQEELEKKDGVNMSQGFLTISKILISKIGGSMGPLYGSFFRGLSVASKKMEVIDSQVMSEMLCKAYSNLSPAIEAYESNKSDFKQALKAMTEVAEKGLESTKTMVAKIGRASRLGERSRGHQDAGATSCYLILKAIADASLRLLEEGE